MNNEVIIMFVFITTIINAMLVGKMRTEIKELQEQVCELSIVYCREDSANE